MGRGVEGTLVEPRPRHTPLPGIKDATLDTQGQWCGGTLRCTTHEANDTSEIEDDTFIGERMDAENGTH